MTLRPLDGAVGAEFEGQVSRRKERGDGPSSRETLVGSRPPTILGPQCLALAASKPAKCSTNASMPLPVAALIRNRSRLNLRRKVVLSLA